MENQPEVWKEWLSLQPLTDKIPQQFQHGLMVDPLSLTCMDAFSDHLVLGTNVGLIYLVHLPSYNIIKLKCENAFLYINCIVAVSSVDDMIAAGCSKGSITIFQVPKVSSSNLTLSQDCCTAFDNKAGKKLPKRFTLIVHQSSITSLVWSRNSMKLFSGDVEGHIFVIEIDYDKSECTGRSLLKVDSRIVQLSYAHQKLAISFLERCLIYDCRTEDKILVGKKARNPPGMFGCVFSSSYENSQEDILYCARPNKKIWSANSMGEVLFSYIHQKIPENSKITLLDSLSLSPINNKTEFGRLFNYRKSTLISHTENCFIVLNVNSQKVLAYCSDFQKICDVAVSGDYVFILENHRKIICISPYRPTFGQESIVNTSWTKNSLTNSVHFPLPENLNLGAIYDIKSKMPFLDKNIIGNITKLGETVASKISEITTPTIISGDKEQLRKANKDELTSSVKIPKPYFMGSATGIAIDTMKIINQNEKATEERISNSENTEDEKRKSSKEEVEANWNINSSVVVVPPLKEKKKAKKMEVSPVLEKPQDVHQIREFISDSRTYEDFKETIEENESLLAEVLDLSCLKMDHENKSNNEVVKNDFSELGRNFNDKASYSELGRNFNDKASYSSATGHLSLGSQPLSNSSQFDKFSNQYLIKDHGYGPPSGSSAIHSSLEEKFSVPCGMLLFKEEIFLAEVQSDDITEEFNTMPPPEDLPWGWYRHHLPAKPETLIGRKNSICLSESKALYFSHDFYRDNEKLTSWKRRKLSKGIKSLSSCGTELFILTTQGTVFNVDWDNLLQPKSVVLQDKNIDFISLDKETIWMLYNNGKVYCRNLCDLNASNVEISCLELRLKSVACCSGVVWALTHNGRIAYRIGIRTEVPFGLEWGIMLHPFQVKSIHLSENGLGWMVNEKGDLYVTLYVRQSFPQGFDGIWWQVGMSDYMLQNENSNENSVLVDNYENVLLTSNEDFLWLSQIDSPFTFSHSLQSFVGHRWNCLSEERFASVCGEGIFMSFGILYCLDQSGQLFAASPHSDRIVPIDLPNREQLASISSRPESLWVLTKSGKIFIRTGLSSTYVLGLKWAELDLRQIADVKLKHISLSSEVVWAVDENGQVYIRQGPLTAPSPKKKGLDPAWLHVDSVELKAGSTFEKVYVGNKSHLVWAIDSNYRIYVREAIFPELSTGTSWVMVSGLLAQSLSISEDLVYAVTPLLNGSGGLLYVREGITATNYIGESWKRIPTHSLLFNHITVSVDNCIWGLEKEGTIFRHSKLHLGDVDADGRPPHATADEGVFSSSDDLEDWEIV